MTRTNHRNSLEAFYAGRDDLFSRRETEILKTFVQHGTMTDRDVCDALGFRDMNRVRPRITELIKSGLLEEIGDVQDVETNRKVRLVRIVPLTNPQQLQFKMEAA